MLIAGLLLRDISYHVGCIARLAGSRGRNSEIPFVGEGVGAAWRTPVPLRPRGRMGGGVGGRGIDALLRINSVEGGEYLRYFVIFWLFFVICKI